MEKIEYKFSSKDIDDIRGLLNILLDNISLITMTRDEIGMADPKLRSFGTVNSKYYRIVKVINRWGLKDETGNFYELLNNIVGRISSCCFLLIIYEPIKLLLFNKLLDGRGEEFTKEEIEIFFLQPFNMITSSCIHESSVYLYDLITKSQPLYSKMTSEDSMKFLNEGVSRRLFMLKANVDSITKIYNESRIKCLDDNENAILSQNINFFYANIYAILDCLAFVLAYEHPKYQLDRNNKQELKNVCLFNRKFYNKMDGLKEKINLIMLKPWYKEIVALRDPIAHRIPLYFPEIYTRENALKIKEIRDEYSKNFNDIFKNRKILTDNENKQIDRIMNESNKLNDAINKLDEEKQKAESNINVFSGCFLHSYEESDKRYHLSRLTFDLGILYYLLDNAYEYLHTLCG